MLFNKICIQFRPNYQSQNTLFCIILSKNGAEKQEMRQISHNYNRFTYHTPSRGENFNSLTVFILFLLMSSRFFLIKIIYVNFEDSHHVVFKF